MKCLTLYTYLLLIIHGLVAANVIPVDFRRHHNTQSAITVLPNTFHRAPHEQSSLKYQKSSQHANLAKYSCDQLKTYFSYHNYSEKNVLDQNMLYLSDEFVKLAKTYPGYELAVAALRKEIRRMSPFGKWYREHITGSYSSQLEARINQLYAEIHHTQQPPAITSLASHYDMREHALTQLHDEWMQCAAISYDQKTKERLNKRIHALDQHYTTSCSPPHKDAYIFAQQHHIDLHEFTPNNDFAIAHVLYQEYVDILGAAAHIPAQNTEILCDALGAASHIGLEANKAGFVEQASKLTDFCWTVLDYARAVGEGIYLGTTNTLHILAHPVETITNALIGIGVITYGLVNLTDFVQHTPLLYVVDNDQFLLRFNAIQNQLQAITKAATTYLTSNEPRTIVKDGTAFITEGFLFGKIVSFAANLTKQILPLAMRYVEYIAAEEPLACLANGELIPIKMTPNIFFNKSSQTLATTTNAMNFLGNVNECLVALSKTTKNKIHHILTPNTGKHAWHLVVDNPLDWKQVAHVIEQVLIDGTISPYGPVLKKELSLKGHIIEVIIASFDDGSLSIVDAWVKTK